MVQWVTHRRERLLQVVLLPPHTLCVPLNAAKSNPRLDSQNCKKTKYEANE